MWIRSQNRKDLINVNEIFIGEPEVMTSVDDTPLVDIMGGDYTLGSYTEERASEVLNEIQRQLVIGTEYDDITAGIRYIHQRVFNMPEK